MLSVCLARARAQLPRHGMRGAAAPRAATLPRLRSAPLPLQLGFGGSQTWVYDPSRQAWVRQGTPQQTSRAASGSSSADGGSAAAASPRSQFDVDDASLVTDSLVGLTAMLFTAALTVILLKLFFAIRTGERPRLRQLLFEGWGPDPAAAAAGAAGAGGVGQQRRRGVGTRAERIETVARIMQVGVGWSEDGREGG